MPGSTTETGIWSVVGVAASCLALLVLAWRAHDLDAPTCKEHTA